MDIELMCENREQLDLDNIKVKLLLLYIKQKYDE